MGLVDTAVVGRAGAVPLAAAGLANSIFIGWTIFGLGVLVGLDGLVSQSLGAGKPTRARELYWQGVWMSAVLAVVVTIPIVITSLYLEAGGIDHAVAVETRKYLFFRAFSIFPMFVFFTARSYLQSVKRTRELVEGVVVANVANFVIDLWLVFGGAGVPPLGAAGAAISTSICSVLQLGIACRGFGSIRVPERPRKAWSWDDIRAIARLGTPVGAHYFAEVGVFALAGFLAARMGAVDMGAHTIALNIASVTFCFALGVSNAGSVTVGWAVGARDTAEARRAGLRAFGVGALFMGTNALLLSLFSRAIASAMTDQQEVLEMTAKLLVVAGAFQLSDGIQGVGAGVLRGAGDTMFTFVANLVGHYLIGLPITLMLGLWGHLGVRGIWWGLSAGLTVVAVSLFARFWRLSSREIVPMDLERKAVPGAPVPALQQEVAGSSS
jgi:MATE family multidrug resistance protein